MIMHQYIGRAELERFVKEEKWVFHGSREGGLNRLDPKIARFDVKDIDGRDSKRDLPMIFATTNIDLAIFMAVIYGIKKTGYRTQLKQKSLVKFYADKTAIKAATLEGHFGYVYVCDKIDFRASDSSSGEYSTSDSVVPSAVVRVAGSDMSPEI
jgi:hypothetical protein